MSTKTNWVSVTDAAENARYLYGLLEKEKSKSKPAAAAAMDVDEAAGPINVDLTAEDVAKMKVSELRSELEARGLSSDGLKKELKERLLAAITTPMDGGDEDSVPEVPGTTI